MKFYLLKIFSIFFLLYSCSLIDPTHIEEKEFSCTENLYSISFLCNFEKKTLIIADNLQTALNLQMSSPKDREFINQFPDINLATALFYLSLLREKINQRFLEYLDKKEIELKNSYPLYNRKDILMVFVPGMFYKSNPNPTARGKSILSLSKLLGISNTLLEINETGEVKHNAKMICSFIKRKQDKKLLIISLSKGSSDVKVALQICREEFKSVKAWISISGLHKGTPLVDHYFSNIYKNILLHLYFKYHNFLIQGFKSLNSNNQLLQNEIKLPKGLLNINIIGVPLSFHITDKALDFYEILKFFGPNDGLSLLTDMYIPGSIHYPIFRNDHYLSYPHSHFRILAILIYCIETAF
ncbi:MAG: hypothetical protein H7A25_16860 [Leptospiraceae bacterium]|nr:hypothetical protein [Leptospiraceae bacterium]MCP5501575.1 hypothetical protein [Leptospiraceae bacterium]